MQARVCRKIGFVRVEERAKERVKRKVGAIERKRKGERWNEIRERERGKIEGEGKKGKREEGETERERLCKQRRKKRIEQMMRHNRFILHLLSTLQQQCDSVFSRFFSLSLLVYCDANANA